MAQVSRRSQLGALVQQGYDYPAERLSELSWALRFTPSVCMAGAVVGLVLQAPAIHFALAALGIVPFWFPAWHPVDRFYNRWLRPLWNGVALPPNPLPRRIACLMGGAMNLGIGAAFMAQNPALAYGLGAMLIVLQLIVITTHFCVASWLYEGLLRLTGTWIPRIEIDEARRLLAAGAELIDVRSPAEFARGHLPAARNVPVERVVAALAGAEPRVRLLYCQSGMRSQHATHLLRRAGHLHCHNLGAMSRLA